MPVSLLLCLMKNVYCTPCSCSPGSDCFFSLFSKIFLYSYSLSSHPLFLTHPFTCYSFISFSSPLQQRSFSPISHHPKPHNQCFLHFPPMTHNFFFLPPLRSCITDVLPFLCKAGLAAGSISSCDRGKHFADMLQILLLAESQASC